MPRRPAKKRVLERPPSWPARSELAAVVEPALRDIPPPPESMLEAGPEPFELQRVEPDDTVALTRSAVAAAASHGELGSIVGSRRSTVLGAHRLLDDKERPGALTALFVYDHRSNRALRIVLEGGDDALSVVEVEDLDTQPPLSPAEAERAISIARADATVAGHLAEGDESHALLTSDVELGDRYHGRRRAAVGFGPADEREPRVKAIVDLGSREVIAFSARRADAEGDPR